MELMRPGVEWLLIAWVFAGTVPLLVSFIQFVLVGLHGLGKPYARCQDTTPNVAFIVPAWNEGASIRATIECLMRLDYPVQCIRVMVVDDASTDDTPEILQQAQREFAGRVFHLRRENGGQGKAHTLNFGLETVLQEPWAEAIVIMDADVLFPPLTLRRMARHLADPEVGAVTAYIKEGSRPGNLLTRFIAFEYIAAQAAARRSQNVTGALLCMAGGAQLHTRQNLLDMGGRIDTSSLAEDTDTTLRTQLNGRKAVFDGNAVVWAEEPGSLESLWKQRLRWARGNLQLTRTYRKLWFRPSVHPRLGGPWFGIVWMSTVAVPLLAILSSLGLWALHFVNPGLAGSTLRHFWMVSALIYFFITLFAMLIDPPTGRRTWLQGLTYPGLISLFFMWASIVEFSRHSTGPYTASLMFLAYSWSSLSMVAIWALYVAEKRGLLPHWLRNLLVMTIGYGALNGAVAFAAILAEAKGADRRWDKTIKTGKGRILE
ncbi:glycosyltransferase family 2 protein [Comamonas sp. MYb21]|uniref:glycosyltransferase n=1 Tax=unclassified Comamonas TaxID=2638500 RepID=UPI003098DDC0